MFRARSSPEERVVDDPLSPIWREHVARYRYAQSFSGEVVLDIACGAGIGLGPLKRSFATVVGSDIQLTRAAEIAARESGAVLTRNDATRLPFKSPAFDVVVCFETIEHVEDDVNLVSELKRVLRVGGVALISTPNKLVTGPELPRPANPFHVREYTPDELTALLQPHFSSVRVLGQRTTASYGRCYYWEPPSDLLGRAKRLALKAALRLPRQIRQTADRFGRPLFPRPEDFEFDTMGPSAAHALLAVCRH